MSDAATLVDVSARIDPSARVHPSARIAADARIGPGAIIGPNAVVGAGCRIDAYGIVGPHTVLGAGCHVFSFAVVGADAQDHRTPADAPHRLICGEANIFREGVTISRGGATGGGETRLGQGNLFMTHSHVGHDCRVGDHNTLANGVSLAGHVEVGDRVTFGGHAAVHQFARVGDLAMIGANAMVILDVPPYCLAAGDRATARGLNAVGLRRAGFDPAVRRALKHAFRQIVAGLDTTGGRRAAAEAYLTDPIAEVARMAAFVLATKRGIVRAQRRMRASDPRGG